MHVPTSLHLLLLPLLLPPSSPLRTSLPPKQSTCLFIDLPPSTAFTASASVVSGTDLKVTLRVDGPISPRSASAADMSESLQTSIPGSSGSTAVKTPPDDYKVLASEVVDMSALAAALDSVSDADLKAGLADDSDEVVLRTFESSGGGGVEECTGRA